MTTFFSYCPLIFFCGLTIFFSGCVTHKKSSDQRINFLKQSGLVASKKITPARQVGEALGQEPSCNSTQEQDEELWSDYLHTLEACRIILLGYETDSIEAKREKRWIMIVGAVAGSVVVPSLAASGAAKSTIAAWGGLSGAANVASHTMQSEGLDATFFLSTRENVRKELDAGIKKFISDESDYCARRNAVAAMVAACHSYYVNPPSPAE